MNEFQFSYYDKSIYKSVGDGRQDRNFLFLCFVIGSCHLVCLQISYTKVAISQDERLFPLLLLEFITKIMKILP